MSVSLAYIDQRSSFKNISKPSFYVIEQAQLHHHHADKRIYGLRVYSQKHVCAITETGNEVELDSRRCDFSVLPEKKLSADTTKTLYFVVTKDSENQYVVRASIKINGGGNNQPTGRKTTSEKGEKEEEEKALSQTKRNALNKKLQKKHERENKIVNLLKDYYRTRNEPSVKAIEAAINECKDKHGTLDALIMVHPESNIELTPFQFLLMTMADSRLVEIFLKAGADPNCHGALRNNFPLICGIRGYIYTGNYLNCISMLLQYGANATDARVDELLKPISNLKVDPFKRPTAEESKRDRELLEVLLPYRTRAETRFGRPSDITIDGVVKINDWDTFTKLLDEPCYSDYILVHLDRWLGAILAHTGTSDFMVAGKLIQCTLQKGDRSVLNTFISKIEKGEIPKHTWVTKGIQSFLSHEDASLAQEFSNKCKVDSSKELHDMIELARSKYDPQLLSKISLMNSLIRQDASFDQNDFGKLYVLYRNHYYDSLGEPLHTLLLLMVDKGFDFDKEFNLRENAYHGDTPLQAAASHLDWAIAEALLRKGADCSTVKAYFYKFFPDRLQAFLLQSLANNSSFLSFVSEVTEDVLIAFPSEGLDNISRTGKLEEVKLIVREELKAQRLLLNLYSKDEESIVLQAKFAKELAPQLSNSLRLGFEETRIRRVIQKVSQEIESEIKVKEKAIAKENENLRLQQKLLDQAKVAEKEAKALRAEAEEKEKRLEARLQEESRRREALQSARINALNYAASELSRANNHLRNL